MWRQITLFGFGWIVVVLVSFMWEYYSAKQNEAQNILEISRTFFNQIVITREWNALLTPISTTTRQGISTLTTREC